MKKVLAWVLALALVLSTFAMSFAAYKDTEALQQANCEGQVNALTALGVVKGYPDGDYKPLNKVTRAEMAALVIRAMGLNDVQESGFETVYKDVPKEAWFSGVVDQATNLGLIKGYNGFFRPEENVSYYEAITMILRALGYKDEALTGEWPNSFKNEAATLGTYRGISLDPQYKEERFKDAATRGDVAIMLYNTLEQVMVTYDGNRLLRNADTFLNRLAKKLGVDEIVKEQDMIVQMCDIVDSDVLDEELLGAPITAMTFDGVVASVYSVNAEKYEVDLDVKSIISFIINKGSKITIDGEKYTVGSTDGWNFYNGYYKDMTVASVASDDGDLASLIKDFDLYVWANIDQKYIDVESTLVWQASKTVQWSKSDINKLKRGEFNEHYLLNKSDEIWTDHFFLKGADSLDKIAEGSIVTFYLGNESYIPLDYQGTLNKLLNEPDQLDQFRGKHITGSYSFANYDSNGVNSAAGKVVSKVEVGTKTVEGTAKETSVAKRTVKIDDVDYTRALPAYCVDGFATKALAGKTGTFYLNYRGEIAAFDTEAAAPYNYAIYLQGKETNEGHYLVGGKEIKSTALELFTAAGEDAWFPLAEGVTGSFDKADKLAGYKVDADGAITTIKLDAIQLEKDAEVKTGKIILKDKTVLPVSDDVVIFTRSAFYEGADWTVSTFAELEEYGKLPGKETVRLNRERGDHGEHRNSRDIFYTQYFTDEEGVVEAIAIDECIADEATQYLFIDFPKCDFHFTDEDAGYFDIAFVGIDGTFQTNDEWLKTPEAFKLAPFLAKVTFETDGTIKSIAPAGVERKEVVYDGAPIKNNQQFIFGKDEKYYPIGGATIYEWDNSAFTRIVSDLDELAEYDVLYLYKTDKDADNYDIVVIYKQD